MQADPIHVAVLGAGVAGLCAARVLTDGGARVTVFEKARGLGGRCTTRRDEEGSLDHGVQYFTARDPRFRTRVEGLRDLGVVEPWKARIVAIDTDGDVHETLEDVRFVGRAGMSAFARALAQGIEVRTGTRVAPLSAPDRSSGRPSWALTDDEGRSLGSFDRLLVTAPPAQAAELLSPVGEVVSEVMETLGSAVLDPCLSLAAVFRHRIPLAFDGAFVTGDRLAWVARDSSKPEHGLGERWVLHTGPAYARSAFASPDALVITDLLSQFASWMPVPLESPLQVDLHRWRHARVRVPLGRSCLHDPDLGLALAGDWCLGDRVEAAYLSGLAAAEALLAQG